MQSRVNRINVDEISELIVDIVHGFIKKCEKKLSIQSIVPDVIIAICLIYFYEPLTFKDHGGDFSLSNNNKTITKITRDYPLKHSSYNYCHGSLWISPNKTTTISVKIDFISFVRIFIGITSFKFNNNMYAIDREGEHKHKPSYLYTTDGEIYFNGQRKIYSNLFILLKIYTLTNVGCRRLQTL